MTEILDLNGPFVSALLDRLRTDLPGRVSAINAAATDGIVLEVPDPDRIYDFPPQGELLTDFPVLGIQDLPSRFADDTGFSLTGHHALGIIIWAADADQRTLAWKLRRYAQAVATVALDTRRLGDTNGILLRGTIPGPTLEGGEAPRTWVSFCMVEISGLRHE